MTARPRLEDLVWSWVSKAENDLLNIENNLAANDIPWDTVCFHAQQGGEKYLKALLVFQRIDFPKIHDLTELYALLPKELPPLYRSTALRPIEPLCHRRAISRRLGTS